MGLPILGILAKVGLGAASGAASLLGKKKMSGSGGGSTPASSPSVPPTPLPIRAGSLPESNAQNLTRMRSIYGAGGE